MPPCCAAEKCDGRSGGGTPRRSISLGVERCCNAAVRRSGTPADRGECRGWSARIHRNRGDLSPKSPKSGAFDPLSPPYVDEWGRLPLGFSAKLSRIALCAPRGSPPHRRRTHAAPQHPGHPATRSRGYPLHPHGHPVALQIGDRLDTAGLHQVRAAGRRAAGLQIGPGSRAAGLHQVRAAGPRSRSGAAGPGSSAPGRAPAHRAAGQGSSAPDRGQGPPGSSAGQGTKKPPAGLAGGSIHGAGITWPGGLPGGGRKAGAPDRREGCPNRAAFSSWSGSRGRPFRLRWRRPPHRRRQGQRRPLGRSGGRAMRPCQSASVIVLSGCAGSPAFRRSRITSAG